MATTASRVPRVREGANKAHVPQRKTGLGRMPDFLIVGAAKSGTTTLFRYLDQHPDVFGCHPKEPCFFDDGVNWDRGFEWYSSLFEGARPDQICGEGSTNYTRFPQVREVPERIRAAIPHAKLIYIMRHPVERAYSHYVHRYTKEVFPHQPIVEPFESFVERDPMCVDGSDYALQIERYLEHFPREQILLLRLEELHRDPSSVLQRVQRFLGLSERDLVGATPMVDNEARSFLRSRAKTAVARSLKRLPGVQMLSRRLRKEQRERLLELVFRSPFGAGAARAFTPPPMRPETRSRLLERYEPSIERLEALMGERLDEWRV